MLKAITGKPGSGKSYYLAYLYTELVKQNSNVIVFSNVQMAYKGNKTFYFYDINDLLTIFFHPELQKTHRIILLDEAYYLLDARNWKSLAPEMTIALRQHRKLLVDMYVVSQDWNNLNIDFRRLVNDVIHARKAFTWFTWIFNKIPFIKIDKPWFISRYEEYKEVSETQKIPFIKNEQMNLKYREGQFVAENPNQVKPDDSFVLGQKNEVRQIFDTMYQVAKPDPIRLDSIFQKSELYKKLNS